MIAHHPVGTLALAVADRLADPGTAPPVLISQPWWRQSLAHGAPGIALLHIELAAAELRPWQRAHDWLVYITSAPLTSGPDSHLFYGAPAVAHAVTCAATQMPGSFGKALDALDQTITADIRRRVDAAHTRIDAGRLPALAEFDVIRGLTGLGSYLLRRDPSSKTMRAVLEYLVRLTEPVKEGGETLPGWWTLSGPNGHRAEHFAGGHANFGMAHGIGGPLSLLALAARRGVTAPGHLKAMLHITQWFDQWRNDTSAGPRWPYWVNRTQLRAGSLEMGGPQRQGWCYGAAGLARAQQLAALATGDTQRLNMAGHAFAQAVADPAQRATTENPSLCHGYAGMVHLVTHVATGTYPATTAQLHALLPALLDDVLPRQAEPRHAMAALLNDEAGPAFLEGASGIALAMLTPLTGAAPRTGWDSCLLIV
ncbi:lanthionine synthetase C family protein [Nonomuraea sp. NPDC046570]|uniref:lanthionine synthetase C family protein n=1 Tax=Nonomuraea sp. NPDC046570 TaxID=3155255 RepID=UPI0033F8259B